MAKRQFAPQIYVAIKADFRAWIEDRFGIQKVAAGNTRGDQQAISDYGNANNVDRDFAPIDVLLDLCHATRDVAPLALIADLLGHRIIPKRPVDAAESTVAAALRSVRESAEATAAVLSALEDNKVDAAERANIRSHLRSQIVAAEILDRLMASGEEANNG